jgi:hypothetical protein
MPAGTLLCRGGKRAGDDRGEPADDVKYERRGEDRPGVRDRQRLAAGMAPAESRG